MTHEEFFDVLGHNDQVLGQQPRSVVHAKGLWHRSVYVLLFNSRNHPLLQRRAATKDICPGLWDLSCAEHLQPGERFVDGARRGLFEELHIATPRLPLWRLRSVHSQTTLNAACGYNDRERVETWATRWDGACLANLGEVSAVRFVTWARMCHELRAAQHNFTPWLRQEIAWLGSKVPWPAGNRLAKRRI